MIEAVVTADFYGVTLDDAISQAQSELDVTPMKVEFSKIDVTRVLASTLFKEGEPPPEGVDKEGWTWIATLTVKGWV